MHKCKSSQVSVEYMLIVGFAAIITIPLIIIYYSFTQSSSEEIVSAQFDSILRSVVDAAESVYYLGEPSQTTLKVNIPEDAVLSNLSNNEALFRIYTRVGEADIVQSSSVNITGSLPTNKGSYAITIRAISNYVSISYK